MTDDDLIDLETARRMVGARPGHARHCVLRGWIPGSTRDYRGTLYIPRSSLPELARHAETRRGCEHRREERHLLILRITMRPLAAAPRREAGNTSTMEGSK